MFLDLSINRFLTHLKRSTTSLTLLLLQRLRQSSQCRRSSDSCCRFSSWRSSSSRAVLRRFARRDWFNIWHKERSVTSKKGCQRSEVRVYLDVTVASVWISLWTSGGSSKLIFSSRWQYFLSTALIYTHTHTAGLVTDPGSCSIQSDTSLICIDP